MWDNLADSDGDNNNIGPSDPNNLGGFANLGYWSSSEYVSTEARRQSFLNGNQGTTNKSFTLRVRAVRTF